MYFYRVGFLVMNAIYFSVFAFISTSIGGIFALRYKKYLHLIMGFTAGVLLGLVAFDLLPEIFQLLYENHSETTPALIALVIGFLLFHIVEKAILIHHSHEDAYTEHQHPTVGIVSVLALSGHSFLDGVGIGLGFHISSLTGILIAIAVISHDFSDGLNSVTLMLHNRNPQKLTLILLLLDAAAPILGVISTIWFSIPNQFLPLYLGFFAGFLLYIGASDILPQAHSQKSSLFTILLTIFGVSFVFVITRFA
jgi:ZIP family zinc transporter